MRSEWLAPFPSRYKPLEQVLVSDITLAQWVEQHFDLRPKGIIVELDLLHPRYSKTAAYGHFGRDELEFSWEALEKVPSLQSQVSAHGLHSNSSSHIEAHQPAL